MHPIETFHACICRDEKKQRLGVVLANFIGWVLFLVVCVASAGVVLLVSLIGYVINLLFSEFNVRRLRAIGCSVSPEQFPSVHRAIVSVAEQFSVTDVPRVIILNSGDVNAFAVSFAKKKVIVLLSEALESVIESEAELKTLLAHELCHLALDHTWFGWFTQFYRPMAYKAARELTCDNAGLAAGGSLASAKSLISKLCVGRRLSKLVKEEPLLAESAEIYKGFTGWLLKQYVSHPSAGRRMQNLEMFAAENQISN